MPIKTHPYGSPRERVSSFNNRFTRWYGSMSRTRRVLTGGLLGVCLLFVVFLISSDGVRRVATGALDPFVRAGAWVRNRVATTVNAFRPLSAVERDMLEELRVELRELKVRMVSADEAREENRQLRGMLDLEPPVGWSEVIAPVILRDPVSWNRRMRIGRGTDDGVFAGAVALAGTEVVGRVIEAGRKSAVVSTVLDPECRLSVQLPESGGVGILQGDRLAEKQVSQQLCIVEYLPKDGTYHEGDAVVTSGLSGQVPGGFLVGFLASDEDHRVSEVVDASFARVNVRPAAQLDRCRFVVVLVPEEDRGAR
jgi:rod shape-determining protein MreC